MPEKIGLVEAATVPMNGLTVRLALDRLGLSPGDTLAVTGAAGAIGGYAVQLAAAEGLKVVAVASAGDEELVRGLGADVFVPRGTPVPVKVDAVIDPALVGSGIWPAVREGGAVVSLRPADGEPGRGITTHLISVREYLREPDKLRDLMRLVEEGRLTPRIAETFPPERAADAHASLEAGGVRGRLVLRF